MPPIWGFLVFRHHLHMNIMLLIPGSLESVPDLLAIEDDRVHNGCSKRCK